jgi:hypothetical protein
MWWSLFVAGVVLFLVFCVLYMEFRTTNRKRFDPRTDPSTNHMNLQVQSNSTRNQSSGL